MLRLQSISKSYGDKTVVAPLDLHVAAGRTCVLIGPSGCGKSTILRMIAGLVQSTQGVIQIGNAVLSRANVRALRRRLGYVIQEGGLFPHLTATENIVLMARHSRWPARKIDERLAALCELTQFPVEALSRYPAELSGGQRQRVSLMRALFAEPELLLLDEPLGALDPLVRYELQCDLKGIFRQLRCTVLMVTHDMGEAAWFGDEIVLLKEGTVVQQGPIEELVHAPLNDFVRSYLTAQRPVPV